MGTDQTNLQKSQPSFMQAVAFDDFENFASTTKEWDIDFRQLDRGPFSAEVKQAFIGSTQFSHAKLNRIMDQRGNPPKNHFTFAIMSGSSLLSWHKHIIPDYFIILYAPGSEIDCVSQPGFHVFTFSQTETQIAEAMHSLELPEPRQVLGNTAVLACSRTRWERLNQAFHRLDQMLFSNPSGPYNSHIYESFDELQRLLLTSFTSTQLPKHRSSSSKNKRTITRVMDYIDVNKREPLTVRDLCGIAGVTERALEYSFDKHFGISPKTYLKTIRLNYVHRELQKADPAETKISNVANSYGFWHMGDFAADYRSLFGELPSKTLRK